MTETTQTPDAAKRGASMHRAALALALGRTPESLDNPEIAYDAARSFRAKYRRKADLAEKRFHDLRRAQRKIHEQRKQLRRLGALWAATRAGQRNGDDR